MRENKIQYRLNKFERIIVCFSVFHGISQLFLGTFVVSFLIHNSINEIVSVSLYNLFFYFAIMLSFVLMIGRCKHGNIKVIFGTHIIIQMFLIALIAMLGAHAANWVMVLGMLYGVQKALYNMSQQQMVIDKIDAKRMIFYCGTDAAATNIAKILVPIILGTLITMGSLQNIAWLMVFMGIIELGMLFMIPPIQNHCENRAELCKFMRQSLKAPCLRDLYHAEFLRGLAYELETVGVLYIVYVFHTDMNLGIWTTVFAILTAMATWCFGRFCSKRDFGWVVGLCSALLIARIIWLIFEANRFSVLAYSGTLALSVAMMDQACSVIVLNLAKTKLIAQKYRAEYLAARQVIAFIGRWGGIIALLYVGVFGGYKILPYLIILLAIARISSAFIFAKMGKYTNEK